MNATGVTPPVPARRQPAGKTAQTLESAHTTGQSSATHFKHHHPTPLMTTITRIIRADWAPHIEQAARRIAPVLVTVYCLGWAFGKWLHRLNDQLAGCAAPNQFPAFTKMVVQRQAAVAAPANIAPPFPLLVHVSDPMARAVRLVKEGKSQRLAASICGVSRTSLQRALKG